MFVLRFAEGGDPKVVEEIESIMKCIEECTDQPESIMMPGLHRTINHHFGFDKD